MPLLLLEPDRLILFEGFAYRVVQVFEHVTKLILLEGFMGFVYKQNTELLDKATEIEEPKIKDESLF